MKILSLTLFVLVIAGCGKKIKNSENSAHFKSSHNNRKTYDPSKNLLDAVKGQSRVLVMQALAENANPNLVTQDGKHLLNVAIETGNLEIVTKLIENGSDVNATNIHDSNYALMIALQNNQKQIAKILINKGAKINFIDRPAPLKYAIKSKMSEIVELLIFNNANLEWNKKYGKGAYELCEEYLPGLIPLIETSISIKNKTLEIDHLFKIIKDSDHISLSFIVKHSKEKLMSIAPSNNLISKAITCEKTTVCFLMVKTLLDAGLSPDGEPNDQTVPLIVAVKYSDYSIAELLIQRGANVNKTNHLGKSPLLVASKRLAINQVELLINNGAQSEYSAVLNGRTYKFKVCRFVPSRRYYLRNELRNMTYEEIERRHTELMEMLGCK